MPDVRELLTTAAPVPRTPVDLGVVRRRATQLRRRRRVAAAAGAAGMAAVVAVMAGLLLRAPSGARVDLAGGTPPASSEQTQPREPTEAASAPVDLGRGIRCSGAATDLDTAAFFATPERAVREHAGREPAADYQALVYDDAIVFFSQASATSLRVEAGRGGWAVAATSTECEPVAKGSPARPAHGDANCPGETAALHFKAPVMEASPLVAVHSQLSQIRKLPPGPYIDMGRSGADILIGHVTRERVTALMSVVTEQDQFGVESVSWCQS